ncbi:hypothetical protein AGABI1DRAFT_104119 [Agaricus bisporus var. burnettii JB137-S8]|uniref:Uncharacterized protein n=1 Tax=Agaricus bisporus var. burnettii (strain JB137-S8 / ATCC MYA-4627 / FGSC 10392) TaxID=597362 RepID=K5Y7F1_AGABU|nr:uncharacterized protein AGABI1DRAFT_104119 [Agaricus bisporus var. burnettii JB137-S8]EKM84160.1 hypothetical protein AGABI1DRAFT_104119 [Agaricus bisporus var. burnettii JB137-S8]
MSFQHFRLGDLSLHGPIQQSLHTVPHHPQLPQHHHQQPISPHAGQSQFPVQVDNPITTFSVSLKKQSNPQPPQAPELTQNTKQPYGSGDADDGYTLVFDNMEKFNEWRLSEEERTMCEFVKGDTHGSKAVPPRFKDHTKLVCARHSRSGRKKYIKKHPERVRKVPSRKLEVGCPASISYKTYFDSEQVRACCLANLPFTRRGRREAALKTDKEKGRPASPQSQENAPSPSTQHSVTNEPDASPTAVSPQPPSASFSSAVSMLAPLPTQNTFSVASPQTYSYTASTAPLNYPSGPSQSISTPAPTNLGNDRWENMATLFQSIRHHARNFEYPGASVAALETILIRLYLESPVGVGMSSANMSSMMPAVMAHARSVANNQNGIQPGPSAANGSTNDIAGGSAATGEGS